LESRPDIPPAATCQTDHLHENYVAAGTLSIYFGDPAVPDLHSDNVAVPGPATGGNQPPSFMVIEPQYAWGIESTSVVGIPIIGTYAPVWVSGSITPAAAGIGVEFPGSGTLYTSASGSYSGILPYGYSGTAVPHYALAFSFTPAFRAYENVVVSQSNQDYTWILNQSPWISGTVTPPAIGCGIEFPEVGTYSVNSTTGSYAGTVPYGYSGTAVPHYWGAEYFVPPVRVYVGQTANAEHEDYSYVPVIHWRGTDSATLSVNFGNIQSYDIYNFVNAVPLTTATYGTYIFASISAASGTDPIQVAAAAFGTHQDVIVYNNVGTDYPDISTATFGTSTLIVVSGFEGTYYGTFAAVTFGTYVQQLMSANAGTGYGTVGVTTFGSYGLSS
jgi:hypothetical protein